MELTLLLSRADAARLHRLPFVKAARTGRSRGAAARMVWHDSVERTLASHGLALTELRGHWRLERVRPRQTEPWPPATDHRLIAEADALDALRQLQAAEGLPEAVTPVAAFDGRRTNFSLAVDDEPVSMVLLDGVLRAVAAEQPTTRLILTGPAPQLRTLLSALSRDLALSVPEQSLAAEALHLADGTQVEPRRRGAPALPPDGLSVHEAFGHIVGHLTDVMLCLASLVADESTGPEPVHQMRVAVRRARSAFSLFRPVTDDATVAPAAAALKQFSQMLGPARDWDVFMTETTPPVEAVLLDQTALHALTRAGTRRRHAARVALSEFLTGPAFRAMILELTCLAADDPPITDDPPPTLNEFAAAELRKRWKKLTSTGKALDSLDSPALHGLRLRAKRLRYAAEFFAPLFPDRPTSRFIHRLAVLQERLGLFNDTMVAETLLRELNNKPGYAAGLVLGFTAARGVRARPKIAAAWARFRRREPFWT